MRLARALGALAVLLALAAGCSAPDPSPGGDQTEPARTSSAPATDQVAALRDAADLAPCPPASTAPPRDTSAAPPQAESDLPTLELACLAGGPDVAVAGLAGTPYVVNFWASDCAPCKEEGPYLQAAYEDADGRVGMLGVNFLDPGGDLGALAGAREFGMRFPMVFDPDGLLGEAFRVPGLPTTFFVDADGVIVGQHSGAFASAEELRAAVERELGVRL